MGKSEIIVTIILFNLFFILFLLGIIVFIKQYKEKKKEHENKLFLQQKEHEQELLTTQLEIQTQTMQYIGREIHDNIGQKLTLASLYTQQLAYENKAPQITENIENISTIINDSLSELRQLSKSLTDNNIEQNSILDLLKAECKKINELKKCEVHFSYQESIDIPSYQSKSILLRITQEFIQNSIKHSKCKNITITLEKNGSYVQLTLNDDGTGFDISQKSNGIGLLNMKKRTEMIGGAYTLDSIENLGTKLTIQIPFSK
ncbi:Two-component sensor histidine kinase [Flavobacterium sp. 9AF]|uniref:sensor histidine kinase n=1 Tax=Flavobacterium sp. 9AF TaxID=2653142 RepID=UPI0012F34433|nr:ATP-binding protein [Flavobacterium sp. 9AF]VXB83682.1 Two-component sensor histidine kinase [Flavobacterium sp. 9AF]